MITLGQAREHARQLIGAGRLAEAASIYEQLLQQVPSAGELWAELGFVYLQTRQVEAAVAALEKAVSLAPGDPNFAINLGTAYRLAKRNDEAIASYERAMGLARPTPELYSNLALAFKAAGMFDSALAALDAALRLRPDYVNGLLNRGNLLRDVGRLEDAVKAYQRLLSVKPDDVGGHIGLGMVHFDLSELDAALACYDRALAYQPNYPEAHRNRAVIWLARGDYERGWPEYEWRLECEEHAKPDLAQPPWDGSPLNGRSLLVYAEQGLGDILHFIRYLPMAAGRGGKVWAEVPRGLAPLLTQSGFGQHVVVRPDLPHFDVHCAVLSLPAMLRSFEPYWPGPYLAADPARVARWQEPLAAIRGFKVGIVWSGNPQHPHDLYRSTRLEQFAPLAAIEGVRLVSLQKEITRADDVAAAERLGVITLDPPLDAEGGAFMDTAAVMQHLDLVITVDTSTAHVAGGLGVPVWVALEFSPDWRWLLTGSRTDWYPTMTLFRQREFNDWQLVFESMAAVLGPPAASR